MNRIASILFLMLCLSCSKEPEPINYGADMCHFCKMTIVTKTHAAQLVSDKGKQYKFDAIECMVRYVENKQDLEQKGQLLIADYLRPGTMINAKSSAFVISPQISSPMGANLTGFESLSLAEKTIDSNQASYFDWKGILSEIND